MSRTKGLVFVLVLALMVFGLVTAANAAAFSDVGPDNPAYTDITKLSALGVINGYLDGTFRPDGNISRAEFAKIAVIMAGLKDSAEYLQNSPSQFSDVPAGAWYTGWVNVAASQGYVKGYTDGTFKPDANVTAAEAITVLMRLLGYDDRLPGAWPVDYLAKAGKLGITSDIKFVASAPATRGLVAQFASGTLEEKLVNYNNDIEDFEPKAGDITLLADSFDDGASISEVLVTQVKLDDDDYVMVTYDFDYDNGEGQEKGKEIEVVLNDDVVVAGAPSVFMLDGRMVDYIVNDDGEAIYVEVNDNKTVFGKVENYDVSKKTVEIDDEEYDLNNKFFVCIGKVFLSGAIDNMNSATFDHPVYGDTPYWNGIADSKVTLYFNDDNDVVYIYKTSPDAAYVIDEVKDDYIKTKTGARITGLDEDNVLILKNGVPVDADELQENDVIYWVQLNNQPTRGWDTYLVAISASITGEVTKYKAADDALYIDGVKYTVCVDNGRQGLYAEDADGDEVTDLADFLGEEVTAYFDGNKEITFITGETSDDKGGIVGVILDAGYEESYGNETRWVKLFTTDGEKVTYDLDEDYYDDNDSYSDIGDKDATQDPGEYIVKDYLGDVVIDGTSSDVNVYALIEVKLNADGEVKDIDWVDSDNAVTPTEIGDLDPTSASAYSIGDDEKDYDRIKVGSSWKYVNDDTVIIDLGLTYTGGSITDDDPAVATWADIEDADNLYADIYYSGDEIDYILIKDRGGIVSGDIDGVFVEAYATSDDDYVVFYVDGETAEYVFDYDSGKSLLEGAIYTFKADSSGEVTSGLSSVAQTVYGTVVYDGINDDNMVLTIGTAIDATTDNLQFKTTGDTFFYEANDDGVSVIDFYDIDEGDVLLILEGDEGVADIVVKLDNEADDYQNIINASNTYNVTEYAALP